METIQAIGDTYVTSVSPDSNFDTLGSFLLVNGATAYLEFDRTGVDMTDIVTINLHMQTNAAPASPFEMNVRKLSSPLDVTTVTYNTRPTIDTSVTSYGTVPAEAYSVFSIDITDVINSIAGDTIELAMRTTDSSGVSISSMESTDISAYMTFELQSNYYVRSSGGSDANGGTSWADAWATVNKGMVTIDADQTLRIGFDENSHADWYDDEPADNKLSPDASNVTVVYETPDTGGGTGYAKVEVNT